MVNFQTFLTLHVSFLRDELEALQGEGFFPSKGQKQTANLKMEEGRNFQTIPIFSPKLPPPPKTCIS